MPTAAPTPCRKPGCSAIAHDGYCKKHEGEANAVRQRYDARRGNSAKRGYDWTWRTRIRPRILRRDPICRCSMADCPVHRGWDGCTRPSTDVDHIVPKPNGGDDDANLQGLCHECHSYKTAKEDGGYGR